MTEIKRYVLGIDGGGTKTHALLVGLDGTVHAEMHNGPANLHAVGAAQCARIVFNFISESCKKADCEPEAIQNIVIGFAGAGRPADRSQLVDALITLGSKNKHPLKNITVETDARIALEAAFAGGPGIVLIAGTGSIALYRTEDNKILRAGGWGQLIGDEGSGYGIAQNGLNVVMRQHDGRSEKTLLTQKAFEHFGVNSIDDLITKIYYEKPEIVAFAPKVLEAAAERDRPANIVLVNQAKELADLVRVLTMKQLPKKKLAVALMGGLLETENPYSKIVKEKIISSLPYVVVQKPKFTAAFGAAIIGLNAFK